MNRVFSSTFWNVSKNSPRYKQSTLETNDEQRTGANSQEAPIKLRGRLYIQRRLISSTQMPRADDLPRAVPTFYDHFPKPRCGVWPTGFRRTGWRRCNPTLIGRCRRRRRKLPPGKTASLSTFTCECTIRYHAVVMTIVRCRGRSGYRVSLCSSRYASVVEWRFFFERRLFFGLGKSSFWLPVTEHQKCKSQG